MEKMSPGQPLPPAFSMYRNRAECQLFWEPHFSRLAMSLLLLEAEFSLHFFPNEAHVQRTKKKRLNSMGKKLGSVLLHQQLLHCCSAVPRVLVPGCCFLELESVSRAKLSGRQTAER